MVSRSLILGYHGCDLAIAHKIVSGLTQQISSTNDYDWLGNGLYFWEDSHARALQWANNDKSGKIKTPAVLGAIIDLGNCLNLIDAGHLDLVKAAHRAYLDFCAASGMKPLQNKGRDFRARNLDKIVFETLHQLRKGKKEQPFDTVRAFLSKVSRFTKMPDCVLLTMFKSVSAIRARLSVISCRVFDRLKLSYQTRGEAPGDLNQQEPLVFPSKRGT